MNKGTGTAVTKLSSVECRGFCVLVYILQYQSRVDPYAESSAAIKPENTPD